ncbi:MAG: ABC transporter ATP-binding protein/permease [Firmicutes bacterium]|nr:ABC transporter ATP-binding protein/permease [Bacillota bacterium]
MIELKQDFFDVNDSSILLGIIMQDSEFIAQGFLSPILNISKASFSFIFSVFFMWQIDPLMTLVLIPIAITIGIIISLISGRFKKLAKESRRRNTVMWQYCTDAIRGIRDIHSIRNEEDILEEFELKSGNMMQNDSKTELLKLKMDTLNNVLLIGLLIVSLGFGIFSVYNEVITIGSLVAILTFGTVLIVPVQGLVLIFLDYQKAKTSKERASIVTNSKKDESYSYKESNIIDNSHTVASFRNVTFKYSSESRLILKKIYFSVPVGTICAFVGTTGSGKSTILKLCDGLYEPTEGIIKIFGKELNNTSRYDLKGKISVAFQETVLFNTTIYENIVFSNKNATEEMVQKAIHCACLEDFIEKLPLGLNTIVGEGGLLISGGERQRIGIARMLLKNAELFLMDEATSSLDNKTEEAVMNNVFKYYKDKTFIIVAHRLTTIQNADLIYVLDEGEIIEQGNHTELMKMNGKYRKLYNLTKSNIFLEGKQI